MHFTSSPLYSRPKKTVLYSTRKYALSWKVLERSANFGADLGFALLQNSQSGQFGFFSPFSHSPLLAEILERSRNSQNRCLPARPVSANRGASRIPTRWACASQPGHPPLRAQFRSGIAYEWSSFLFLGLGELLGVACLVFYQ